MPSISLLSPLGSVPVVFIDVETTGASPDSGHRVIEVATARYLSGAPAGQWQQLLQPDRAVPPVITRLTGITPDMLVGRPRFRDIASDLLGQLSGAVVVGHNVLFDLGFLAAEFRRARIDLAQHLPAGQIIDTLRLARRLHAPRGNGLQALAERLSLRAPDDAAHRALADVQTTFRLFVHLLGPMGLWDMPLCDVLKAQGGAFKQPINHAPRRRPWPAPHPESPGPVDPGSTPDSDSTRL